MVGCFEQQGQGHLGDGLRAVSGGVADRDAVGCGRCDVYAVVARGGYADEAQPREGIEVVGREARFVDDENVGVSRAGEHFVGRRAVVDGEVSEPLESVPRRVAGIDGVTVEKGDVQHKWIIGGGNGR